MTDSERESRRGDDSDRFADDSNAQERQQRVEALRALTAGNSQASTSTVVVATSKDTWIRPRRSDLRMGILIGLIVLIIVGSTTGYLLIARSKSLNGQKKPPVHAIDLSASKLYCPQTPVWSPDGRQIAIIASDIRCIEQNNTAAPDQFVGVFDVTTGKAQRIITVKEALAQHQIDGPVKAVAWSPDGKMLALFGPVRPTSTTGVFQQALILYPTADQHAASRVIIGLPINMYTPQPQVQVWDVGATTAGPVIESTLAPALNYRWLADGQIVPDQPLSSDATTMTGRAAGHDGFTLWQAGQLDAMSNIDGQYADLHISATGPVPATAVFFSALPVVWSSDSRYVVSGIGFGGPVAFSTPPTSRLTCPGPGLSQAVRCPPKALPQPDPAFAAIVKATLRGEPFPYTDPSGNSATVTDWPTVPVVWSPNGKYLLTILPGNEERNHATKVTVTAFDTATGKAVKQFQAGIPAEASSCYSPLTWSPTGKQIAMYQCDTNSIILWDTGNLQA